MDNTDSNVTNEIREIDQRVRKLENIISRLPETSVLRDMEHIFKELPDTDKIKEAVQHSDNSGKISDTIAKGFLNHISTIILILVGMGLAAWMKGVTFQ